MDREWGTGNGEWEIGNRKENYSFAPLPLCPPAPSSPNIF